MLYLLIIFAKIFSFFLKVVLGSSGSTWPGHLVLNIYPSVLKDPLLKPERGVVLITGTNGKTTTTKMVAHVLRGLGFSVVTNSSGANLKNGLVSSLLLGFSFHKDGRPDYIVLEVDEFSLPQVLGDLKVDVLALLNLSRDQLDRYGEVDLILERWKESIGNNSVGAVVLDRSHPLFKDMSFSESVRVLDFGSIPEEGVPRNLSDRFYFRNVSAVLMVLKALGFSEKDSLKKLDNFQEAYGRGELVTSDKVSFRISLVKNPDGMSTVLKMLSGCRENFNKVLFVLNDNIPDGRDVSWIYDVEPQLLEIFCRGRSVYVSGTRCFDMAVRLEYAGVVVCSENVSPDLKDVLYLMRSDIPVNVAVLPNYSAMLDLRNILLGRKIL